MGRCLLITHKHSFSLHHPASKREVMIIHQLATSGQLQLLFSIPKKLQGPVGNSELLQSSWKAPGQKWRLFFSLKTNVGLKTTVKYVWKLFPPNVFWKEFWLLAIESPVIDLAPRPCWRNTAKVVPANTFSSNGVLVVGHMGILARFWLWGHILQGLPILKANAYWELMTSEALSLVLHKHCLLQSTQQCCKLGIIIIIPVS